jgi:outer membrane protein assembly factor BamD
MQKRLLFLLILSSALVFSSCSKFQKLLKKGSFEEKYKAANEYYKKKDYYRASVLFEEVAPNLKGSDQQELAEFYFAYCKYHQGFYAEANHQFRRFAETFARSEHVTESTYMAAYSLYKDSADPSLDQTSTITAIAALQEFINLYPESDYAKEADTILKDLRKKLERKSFEKAKLYLVTKDYDFYRLKSAVIAMENFQKDYPDSDLIEESSFLKVEAGYEYAKLSILSKQVARYNDVITSHQTFVDKYPQSKYIKQSERYFDLANKDLVKVTELLKEEKILKDQFEKEQKEREEKEKQKVKDKEKEKASKIGVGSDTKQ